MLIEKPATDRVYITAVDPSGKRNSKSITVYETTPEAVIKLIEGVVGGKGNHRGVGRRRVRARQSAGSVAEKTAS